MALNAHGSNNEIALEICLIMEEEEVLPIPDHDTK
jgi:hypothetical protein